MILNGEGGAGLLHSTTEPGAWRGGLQILECGTRCGPAERDKEKRKEWKEHWQCNSEQQKVEDNPGKNPELIQEEDAMPGLRGEDLEKVATPFKQNTGIECDRLHPRAPSLWILRKKGKVTW